MFWVQKVWFFSHFIGFLAFSLEYVVKKEIVFGEYEKYF